MRSQPHTPTFVTVREVIWRLTEVHASVYDSIADPRIQGALDVETRALLVILARQRAKLHAGLCRFVSTHGDDGLLDTFIQSLPGEQDLSATRRALPEFASAEVLGVRTITLHHAAIRWCRQLASAGLSPAASRLFGDFANQLEAMAKQLAVALQDRGTTS